MFLYFENMVSPLILNKPTRAFAKLTHTGENKEAEAVLCDLSRVANIIPANPLSLSTPLRANGNEPFSTRQKNNHHPYDVLAMDLLLQTICNILEQRPANVTKNIVSNFFDNRNINFESDQNSTLDPNNSKKRKRNDDSNNNHDIAQYESSQSSTLHTKISCKTLDDLALLPSSNKKLKRSNSL